ncbi:transcription termination factor, N utilization substance protein B [Crocosphaera subtropica ATCC 51142]|uniref:Transcription antitermination protein NusB n=1 Tax=Crocosphaera subtropica (strain ATCC 51142 / BH68) TaxID=43989 RepID=NUSB_CROS5|nr:transcription antitermination factor NusB [Crocosphaera subtropica]B1WXY6.1 RecName: Full=Transcription antitermination protein NusB; AltName: Full=Antitermination factor NusB [Crocosphaera subtropica ATCC 51142]ACB50973.1 transcription termination factor, N utilization substance protein B [Crocosphaera subtropica ATCC 51142]
MAPRQQPRRIARELALLSLSQIKGKAEKLDKVELNDLTLAAIRALTSEVQDTLETASAEVKRGHNQLFQYETKATTLESAKTMIKDALTLTQEAINRLANAIEFPEIIQLASQYEVREYAIELIGTINRRRKEIDEQLEAVLKDWQLKRLAKIDQDILRLAVAEILFLDVPEKVSINEAVELAKRYSDDDGYRFINGVLRRFTDHIKHN